MRTSVLSRAAIAVATVAIGSVTLAAVPATAATPSGITRDEVLAAAQAVRTYDADLGGSPEAQLNAIATKVCAITSSEHIAYSDGYATKAGASADGLMVTTEIADDTTSARLCEFGAVAVVDPSLSLSGSATISGQFVDDSDAPPVTKFQSGLLSGDVYVTPILRSTPASYSEVTTFTTSGNATKTTTAFTSTKVADPKTAKQKKVAKKRYTKALTAAKKSYKKAVSKAGSNKSKKTAAKKAYAKKRSSAKLLYSKATRDYKIVNKTTRNTVNLPFSLSATDA